MNLKAFFVDALGAALETGLGTPEDVLRYVTPDVLAQHLPRPLWARLLTACLGAPRVDAQLVVETIGFPNLAEHIPNQIVWNVIADIATRALGGVRAVAIPSAPTLTPTPAAKQPSAPSVGAARTSTPAKGVPTGSTPAATPNRGVPLAPPPPAAPPAEAPTRLTPPSGVLRTNIPAPNAAPNASASALANLDLDDEPPTVGGNARTRTPTGQRFRQAQTGGLRGMAAASARRPQAQAAAAPQPAATGRAPVVRRGATEVSELETETSVEKEWGDREIAVDDEQLVDWQSSEETSTGDSLNNRKR